MTDLGVGMMAMLNMLTLERATAGSVQADGLSISAVDTTQTLLLLLQAE